jgi:hypothetical protein
MSHAISRESRRELIEAVGDRYRTGGRAEKRRILDDFVAVTGWHRKHPIRALSREGAAALELRIGIARGIHVKLRGPRYTTFDDPLAARSLDDCFGGQE